MKVLVVYELIHDDTQKAVVEMTEEEYKFFKRVNNYIVNISDFDVDAEDVALVIDNAFCDKQEYLQSCDTDKQREYFGKFKNEDISEVDKLIWCGFYS